MATAVISDLSVEEVWRICSGSDNASTSGIGESLRGDFSSKLNGEVFELIFDDLEELKYIIGSPEKLRWISSGREFSGCAQILELETAPGLFLINHLRPGTFPLENITLILDVENGLCTLILSKLGAACRPRDVECSIHFGRVKNSNLNTSAYHCFTNELVHKIIDWHYDSEGIFVVKHMYVSNEHMVYYLAESDGPDKGLVEAAEVFYVKVRENVYIMSWLEKGHQGMQGVALMDLHAMHDIGNFFGISINNTLDNYTFAARGVMSEL